MIFVSVHGQFINFGGLGLIKFSAEVSRISKTDKKNCLRYYIINPFPCHLCLSCDNLLPQPLVQLAPEFIRLFLIDGVDDFKVAQ